MKIDNKNGSRVIIPSNDKKDDVNPFATIEAAQMVAIDEKLSEVLEPLKALDKAENSKVPVEYFRSTFASKFQNMIDEKKSDEKTIRGWLKIAGGGDKEVDLIDNDGNIVDTIPRLLGEIPPLGEVENRKVKTMAQMVVLDGENQNGSVNFFAEEETRQNLSSIGVALSKAVLTYEPNIENSRKFKEIVNKYSNKLSDEQIQEKIDNVEATKVTEYIID